MTIGTLYFKFAFWKGHNFCQHGPMMLATLVCISHITVTKTGFWQGTQPESIEPPRIVPVKARHFHDNLDLTFAF